LNDLQNDLDKKVNSQIFNDEMDNLRNLIRAGGNTNEGNSTGGMNDNDMKMMIDLKSKLENLEKALK
jgi:hypothetical protein